MIFAAIGRDLRHAQLELLDGGPVESRVFGEWSMCAQAVNPAAGPILKTLELTEDFDPFQMEGAKALALMQAIARSDALSQAAT